MTSEDDLCTVGNQKDETNRIHIEAGWRPQTARGIYNIFANFCEDLILRKIIAVVISDDYGH